MRQVLLHWVVSVFGQVVEPSSEQRLEPSNAARVNDIHARLQSSDPRVVAWAVNDAVNDGLSEVAPELMQLLDRLPTWRNQLLDSWPDEVDADTAGHNRRFDWERIKILAPSILDALIQLGAQPSVTLLLECWSRRHDDVRVEVPVLILLARDPEHRTDAFRSILGHLECGRFATRVASQVLLEDSTPLDPDGHQRFLAETFVACARIPLLIHVTAGANFHFRTSSKGVACSVLSRKEFEGMPEMWLWEAADGQGDRDVCIAEGPSPCFVRRVRGKPPTG